MEIRFPLILDGATGTELQKRGYTGESCAEQWVLEHPETIREVQRGYLDAGSRVVYAPTFGANRQKLEERGIMNRTAEYNRRLAALSQEAAAGRAWVAGDIAPTGLFLAPLGEASFEELVDIYTEQAAGLEEAGVDLYAIETMMTLSDARAAVLAVRSVSDKPIFVSFTCDPTGRTLTGTDVAAALTVLQRLREYARVPLLAKPNAGMPEIVDGRAVYDCPPEEFTACVPAMLEAGVAIFGGCCGTDRTHIAALRAALEGKRPAPPSPAHPELLPAATEKDVFLLSPDAGHGPVLRADASLEDALADAQSEPEPTVALALGSWDELDALVDCQFQLEKPLCLVCDDAELLEAALRLYQGRALYEGSLPEATLLPLCEKYGLLI